MRELAGRVAVVTGGGSGIGAALSLACAGRGMRVAVADVEEAAAEDVARGICDQGGEAFACALDVRSRSEIERLADDGELRSQMGRAAHLDVERVFGAIPVGKAIAELYGHALKLSATITNDGEPNQ